MIERTFTGNSAHYVLDAKGRVVDAIPGLVAPGAFVRALADARARRRTPSPASPTPTSASTSPSGRRRPCARRRRRGPPTFRPRGSRAPAGSAVGAGLSDEAWAAVARLHADDARLSRESVRVMETKTNAVSVMPIALAKGLVETPLARAVRRFSRSLAEDSVRNEYVHRRTVRARLATDEGAALSVDALNDWVYAEVFLTPSSDPWLGLVPPEEYSALDGGGLRVR